jgi:HD-like signal output (HDOD) protein
MPLREPIDLSALIAGASELEPLPANVSRLVAAVSREDWSMDDVCAIASLDQGLAARLLRLANAALSGPQHTVHSVQQAVVRVGTSGLLSLAMALSVRPRLRCALPEYGLSEEQLWRHSVAAALAVDCLRTQLSQRVPPEAGSAALLHDLGKLLLARHLDAPTLSALRRARASGGCSEQAAEIELLGVHHGELGGLLAQEWQLPAGIVQGIAYHHAPEQAHGGARERLVALIVHVADVAASELAPDVEPAGAHEARKLDAALAALALPAERHELVRAALRARLSETLAVYA